MGLGFGALKQMSDTFKYNRDLLGKKKSLREIYKDEIEKRGTTEDKQNLEFVRLRVAKSLKRNRIQEFITRTVAILTLVVLIAGLIWIASIIDFTPARKNKYPDKRALYHTIIYQHSEDLKLRTDYFHSGPKASETLVKDGLRHQTS